MEEFNYELKVPKDRVAVLVGVGGSTRKKLVSSLKVKVFIDSKEGVVNINSDDGLKLMVAKDVVRAIARGFNPEVALNLIREDYMLDVIDITDYTGRSKKKLYGVKGRLIGQEGKTRKNIKYIAGVDMVVYGKTVSLIGEYSRVSYVRRAIEILISGSRHGYAYKWLEEKISELGSS